MAGDVLSSLSEHDLHIALYREGLEAVADRILLAWAGDNQDRSELLTGARRWEIPNFPLQGRDVLVHGRKPGDEVGTLLKTLKDDWIANDFKADRSSLDQQLKDRIDDLKG